MLNHVDLDGRRFLGCCGVGSIGVLQHDYVLVDYMLNHVDLDGRVGGRWCRLLRRELFSRLSLGRRAQGRLREAHRHILDTVVWLRKRLGCRGSACFLGRLKSPVSTLKYADVA